MNIIEALDDPLLFSGRFSAPSWQPWKAFLKSLFGLRLSKEELDLYRACTGRNDRPREPASECWLVAGRRSGKSFIVATVATYLAAFRSYQQFLSPGETPVIMCLAGDRRQARVIFEYISGLLQSSDLLASMIEKITAETIHLNNSVVIEVHVNSYRSVRGFTAVGVLCDEISFWRSETSYSPDTEVINALRPALSTVPGSMLLCLSSPYRRAGALWQAFKRHYGHEGDPVLIWQAPSTRMNSTLSEDMIRRATEADPVAAQAEWQAEFRSDLQSFIDPTVVESAIDPGVYERPWRPNVHYVSFCDPSGGRHDSMCTAIAHAEGDRVILDCLREIRAPFNPDSACAELSAVLKSYSLTWTVGDRYSAQWVVEGFAKCGVNYRASEQSKSDLYLSLLALLNSGRISLIDNQRLTSQLCTLERRTARGGRDSVDHPPYALDDLANATAGCLVGAKAREPIDPSQWLFGEPFREEPLASLTGLSSECWEDQFPKLRDF